MSKSQPFQINWLGATGSALGAVSSAVMLSTLGAAGTLFGAALGSLVITVGGSIYTQSLQKTKDRVQSRPRREPYPSRGPGSAEEPRARPVSASSPDSPNDDGPEPSKGLPWKRIIGLTVGLFVVAMAIILAFELSTGRPVSSFTGGTSNTTTGTTFSGLRSSSDDAEDPDAVEPDERATSTEQPTKAELKEEEPEEEEQNVDEPREEPKEENPADAPPADAPPANPDE